MRASEHGWTVLHAERAQVRELDGHQLRIEIETGGFRLFVDGKRRGFFDTSSHARSHAFWLVHHGNPTWREELCEGPHAPDQPRTAVCAGLCQFHRTQLLRNQPLTPPQRRKLGKAGP